LRLASFPFIGVVVVGRNQVFLVGVIVVLVVVTVGWVSES
jgi:hypothetical protein